MRAAAVAFVLIVGAAVVLWFGNTLNSLVLGGLIGGLAALLLSIPISLILFSMMTRRHEERLRAEMQEEMSLAQSYEYEQAIEHVRGHETDAYRFPEEIEAQDPYFEEEYDQELEYEERPAPRKRPTTSNYPRLPAPRQQMTRDTSPRTYYHSEDEPYSRTSERQPRTTATGSIKRTTASQRLLQQPPPRRTPYSGLPAAQGGVRQRQTQSQHLNAALRAARLEEFERQREEDEFDYSPTIQPPARKMPRPRPSSSAYEQEDPRQLPPRQRTSRQLPSQNLSYYGRQQGRSEDSGQLPGRRPRAVREQRLANEYDDYDYEPHEEEEQASTYEYDERRNQRTTGSRRQTSTGHARHYPEPEDRFRYPNQPSGNLKNPLVRRAPYLYEDDPLREELSQQIEGPIMRRSSRYSQIYNEDEED